MCQVKNKLDFKLHNSNRETLHGNKNSNPRYIFVFDVIMPSQQVKLILSAQCLDDFREGDSVDKKTFIFLLLTLAILQTKFLTIQNTHSFLPSLGGYPILTCNCCLL